MLETHTSGRRQRTRHLEGGEDLASVAAGAVGKMGNGVVVGIGSFDLQSSCNEMLDRNSAEWFEAKQRAAASQRSIDLEERVLGGGSDQRQRAVLDGRQERVLLRLRKSVNLVEEQNRAPSMLTEPLTCTLDRFANIFDTGSDGAQLFERSACTSRHGECQRCLARARRTPKDRTRQSVLFDEAAQRAARTDEVFLADHIVERLRS